MSPNRFVQRRQQTHQQLLDAAEQVFSEKGYDATSILDITDAADVSKRTFYLHFKDKEDLIEKLALRNFEAVRLQLEADQMSLEGTPREIHTYLIQKIFEYLNDNQEMLQLIANEDGSHRLNSLTRTYITQAMAAGFADKNVCEFRRDAPVPVEVLGNAIGGMTFQLICWWADNTDRYTPAQMAEMSATILFDGVGINFQLVDKSQEEMPAE